MSFDWQNYLIVAKELCGRANGEMPTQEAKLRCAISRSYYSAFCSSKNFIKSKGQVFNKEKNIHEEVKKWFAGNDKDRDYLNIANNLDRLRIARNKADYDNTFIDNRKLEVKNLTSEAISSLLHSENILSSLKKLTPKIANSK